MLQSTKSQYKTALKLVLTQVLQYIRYTQMIPMIIALFFFTILSLLSIFYIITGLICLVLNTYPEQISLLINKLLAHFNLNDFNYQYTYVGKKYGISDILNLYALISLIIFALASLLKYVFHYNFKLDIKKKIKYLLIITTIGYILFLLAFASFTSITTFTNLLIISIIFWLITNVLCLYSFLITAIIEKITDLLNKVLN